MNRHREPNRIVVEIVNGPVRQYGRELDAHFDEAEGLLRVNARVGLAQTAIAAFYAGEIVGRARAEREGGRDE